MILPFGIMGSTQLWNSDNPSYWNYGINTCSQVPKSPDLFWTKVQGWYNPTTFLMTEVHRIHSEPKFKDDTILPPSRWLNFTRFVLNRSPRMIQSYHLLDDWSSPDPFWIEFQGWYNPGTFSMIKFHRIHFEPKSKDNAILPHSWWLKFTGSILNWIPRMI